MSRQDFSLPLCLPFLDGVYAAANAISDVALVLDSPSCAQQKAERFHGNQDWQSTLSSVSRQRIFHSNLQLNSLAMGDESNLHRALLRADKSPDTSAVILSSATMTSITDKQFDLLLDEFSANMSKPVFSIPSRNLRDDWLDGYAGVLNLLAEKLPLCEPSSDRNPLDVAVVGYFFERNEADQTANVAEISALLKQVGLNVVSFWLSGGNLEHLKQAGRAGTVVSLPYGRKAAKTLSERSGAALVDVELPIGIDATAAFIRKVASISGKTEMAENLISDMESLILPKLSWPVENWMMNRSFVLLADPFMLQGLTETFSFFGAIPLALFCNAGENHVNEILAQNFPLKPVFEPGLEEVRATLKALQENGAPDLCIGESVFLSIANQLRLPVMEIGFPSYFTHALTDRPFMGYGGVSGLVERFANALSFSGFVNYGNGK